MTIIITKANSISMKTKLFLQLAIITIITVQVVIIALVIKQVIVLVIITKVINPPNFLCYYYLN